MQTLLEKVKANLILQHNEDDELLQNLIFTATAYAESYQKRKMAIIQSMTCTPPLNRQ